MEARDLAEAVGFWVKPPTLVGDARLPAVHHRGSINEVRFSAGVEPALKRKKIITCILMTLKRHPRLKSGASTKRRRLRLVAKLEVGASIATELRAARLTHSLPRTVPTLGATT